MTSDTGELQTYEDVEPREQQECETDADCVPLPTCHPRTCINKKYTSFYERPEACTEMFDCSAAYDASACECVGSRCTNMNLGDKGCADQGESAE
ncbi:TPA: hypothetical protein HA265_01720 [Candidatus Woesearchaeota archaeon]|nr:hypothetical protein [Candidatus Woesearchaeota archaeon]